MEYLTLGVAMLITGMAAGMLAGLLGVGGGIVLVPVLEAALELLGVDPSIRMHIAVATSLATIIPTSISSTRAHYKHHSVDLQLARNWFAFILLGALLGSFLASQVHSRVLAAIFAAVALAVAIKMMLPLDHKTLASAVPQNVAAPVLPATIGTLSSMMGIGGGTLTVPILTLLGHPIHRAVGTAALFGLLISIPGALSYIFTGAGHEHLPPGSLGFVNLIGLALIAPTTVLTAPLGAKIAHRMSCRRLSVAFGVFLFVVAVRMFYQAVSL